MTRPGRWRIGLLVALLATALRVAWALAVPTIPVGDFATYRESAIHLAERGYLDGGFVYMPAWVWLLAAVHVLGGEVTASKLLGAIFGGLAAAPIYLVTAWSLEGGAVRSAAPRRALDAGAVALTAGLAYAFWPAGIALASVIGTDIPGAAVMLLALAFLCGWGETRPLTASVAFGLTMGLAAYFRAVALPLTALSAVYWLLRRSGARATVIRTTVAVAMTVLVLLPWGIRNQRRNGEFYLTDSHGGITALMGNYPNTEGRYARSLAVMFQQLTGRTFLMEPHRRTDRAAYDIAKQWMGFDLAWTAGMIALRTERLFAFERGLLYWSIYRPGVLPPSTAAWFNRHRPTFTGMADLFYLLFVAGWSAGIAFACAERRWTALTPLPFAAALAVTYALFVAEPRYRLATEILCFPLAAFGVFRLSESGRRAVGAMAAVIAGGGRAPWLARWIRGGDRQISEVERTSLWGTLVVVATVAVVGVAVVKGGEVLRERHRWAAAVWKVNGRSQAAFWRPLPADGGTSPVRGAPAGAALTVDRNQGGAGAEIHLPGQTLPPGPVNVSMAVTWLGAPAPGAKVHLATHSAAATGISAAFEGAGGTAVARGVIAHAGGPLQMLARIERNAAAGDSFSVSVEDVILTTTAP